MIRADGKDLWVDTSGTADSTDPTCQYVSVNLPSSDVFVMEASGNGPVIRRRDTTIVYAKLRAGYTLVKRTTHRTFR